MTLTDCENAWRCWSNSKSFCGETFTVTVNRCSQFSLQHHCSTHSHCQDQKKKRTVTIMRMFISCKDVLITFLLVYRIRAFAPAGKRQSALADHMRTFKKPISTFPDYSQGLLSIPERADTKLFSRNQSIDGSGRGNFILALSILVCVWIFSIPPEFRRAHFCTTAPCVENRAACYDCVTFDEWRTKLKTYYDNGGGLQFDFTIDPNSKQKFYEATGFKQ